MFRSKMINHDVYALATATTNDYNEVTATLTCIATVPMFIALNAANQFRSNDISVLQCAYVGIAPVGVSIEKGNLIDNKYQVEYVVAGAHEDFFYLKELNNDGRINI